MYTDIIIIILKNQKKSLKKKNNIYTKYYLHRYSKEEKNIVTQYTPQSLNPHYSRHPSRNQDSQFPFLPQSRITLDSLEKWWKKRIRKLRFAE